MRQHSHKAVDENNLNLCQVVNAPEPHHVSQGDKKNASDVIPVLPVEIHSATPVPGCCWLNDKRHSL